MRRVVNWSARTTCVNSCGKLSLRQSRASAADRLPQNDVPWSIRIVVQPEVCSHPGPRPRHTRSNRDARPLRTAEARANSPWPSQDAFSSENQLFARGGELSQIVWFGGVPADAEIGRLGDPTAGRARAAMKAYPGQCHYHRFCRSPRCLLGDGAVRKRPDGCQQNRHDKTMPRNQSRNKFGGARAGQQIAGVAVPLGSSCRRGEYR